MNKKKLIEVALPLEAINKACAHEKMPGIGPHPRGLHQWWARRPLAAARAVIFAQMVDDPSTYVETLLSDSVKKRAASRELTKRRTVWEERKAKYEEVRTEGQQAVLSPGPPPTLEECAADIERERLFEITRKLVLWENTTNETVLLQAREEIWQSWRRTCAENADHPRAKELFDRHRLPAFHDPFAGGGALPLEAQRLGLETYASDLNPVAVLINKAMIEIPPKFAGKPPVNPEARSGNRAAGSKKQAAKNKQASGSLLPASAPDWKGAQGLAEDVRYYSQWMRDEAGKRIGHLYPNIEITAEMTRERPDLKKYLGQKLTVIAWLWARTVKSPNPAFANVDVPLASTFMLSTKAGKEAYVEPVIENGNYRFTVKNGKPKNADAAKNGTSAGKRAAFNCLMSGTPLPYDYIRNQGKAGRMSARLMAIVAEGKGGRVYLAPTTKMEAIALTAKPTWKPETTLPVNPRDFKTPNYGLATFADLFTSRQLVALTTFSDLVQEARDKVKRDAGTAGLADDGKSLDGAGTGAQAYADAVAVYLAFAVDRCADYSNTCTLWAASNEKVMHVFGKQAIAMTWDFPEAGVLNNTVGGLSPAAEFIADCLLKLPSFGIGKADQRDAAASNEISQKIVSTDPPYYDNIGYADLSDFFYVWLRRSLKLVFVELLSTVTVPKLDELVATPYRHGSKEKAEAFFLDGMTRAMNRLAEQSHPAFPVTIYYAFKQSESDGADGTASTGWETFLEAVIQAGFAVTGTWPMRSEQEYRMIGVGTNALASSIVLVCRHRPADAPTTTRRDFMSVLKTELPAALVLQQRGNIAPVDLAQAAIGPGMAVYTRYSKVLDAEGKALSVREALSLINQTLGEALAEQEGDFDADTRWALTWFEQSGFAEGEYGVAEQLSKSKNISVNGVVEAGILESKRSKVRLLKPAELPADWDPETDKRLTVWEMVHHLIRVLESGGEGAAATLAAKLGGKAETARELCYRLYTICERKKRAAEALSYNALVQSWPEIMRLAREGGKPQVVQTGFLDTEEKD